MNIFDDGSLYKTVTNAARELFFGGSFSDAEKAKLANWILDHQNRCKGFMFYPSEQDREGGIQFFSGEKPRAKFLVDNLVELETLRVLALIQPGELKVRSIFQEANRRIYPLCFANGCIVGECAHASIAFRRYLLVQDQIASGEKNRQTLQAMKLRRSDEGKWRGFPFYFTLLWLTELPGSMGGDELDYAREYCERLSRRMKDEEPLDEVRRKILQRALER